MMKKGYEQVEKCLSSLIDVVFSVTNNSIGTELQIVTNSGIERTIICMVRMVYCEKTT